MLSSGLIYKHYQIASRINRFSLAKKSSFKLKNLLSLLPVTDKDRYALGLLLQRAGFKKAESLFVLVGIKLLGLVTLPLLVFAFHDGNFGLMLLAKCSLFGLLGSMAPEWWLTLRANKNQEQMQAAMPDAVDLMVICAESGLHLDAILKTVGEDIQGWSARLSEELLFTCAQLNMGMSRSTALSNFSIRLKTEEAKHLVSALIQSDQYGTPLVKTLRDLATDIRRIRGLKIEEKMGKVPALMSLPLMIFVLFPLVILLAAPPLISLIRSLQGIT
jgi:tight adherence protein C